MSHAGFGGFAVADFDGDGKQDVAIPFVNGGALIEIAGRVGESIGIKQIVQLPDEYFQTLFAHDIAGTMHLFALGGNGILRDYAGWPLALVRTLEIPASGSPALAVGDIDADGQEEIVVVDGDQNGSVRAYDLADGRLRWSLPHDTGTHVRLAQLDADPALEIVVDGYPLRVIDGATLADEWSFDDGYYERSLALGHFRDGGGVQFATALGWSVPTIFGSAPYAALWRGNPDDILEVASGDLDHDGYDELITGERQWGPLQVYAGASQEARLTIPHPASGIRAVSTVDIDGNAAPAIAFSSGSPAAADDDLFRIVDGQTGSTRFDIDNREPGPYAAVALVGTDAQRKLYYASQGTVYTNGRVTQLDAASGAIEWQSPSTSDLTNPYGFTHSLLGTAARAGRAPAIIAFGGGSPGRYVALDSVDHAVLWQLGYDAGGPTPQAFAMIDSAADGNDDLAVCGPSPEGLGNKIGIFVLSGADGSERWHTPVFGEGLEPCNGLVAGRFREGENPLIAAVLPTAIHAYDAITQASAWTFDVDADGATLIDVGGAGTRELVVFKGSLLRFYDAGTRALLRQFDVAGDVTAVRETAGDIHRLLVAAGGHLMVVDGVTGTVFAASGFLGQGLADRNQLAAVDVPGGATVVGVGSMEGVFRFVLHRTEEIFADGLDAASPIQP